MNKEELRKFAIRWLARREYGYEELKQKLLLRTDALPETAESLLQELVAAGLQSDARFVEAVIASRMSRGFGPVFIRAELQAQGVSDAVIASYLDFQSPEWIVKARKVAEKKPPQSQRQFLQYRGFTYDQIKAVVGDESTIT